MLVSELIAKLQSIRASEGDIQVVIHDHDSDLWVELQDVDFIQSNQLGPIVSLYGHVFLADSFKDKD